ncbi:hypothetical protein DL769_001691 [Monosporascus sp. CRB-8-3]|nr:hypothetical protein DL769_001691 [Monosporascus sp. CRB-8-3]
MDDDHLELSPDGDRPSSASGQEMVEPEREPEQELEQRNIAEILEEERQEEAESAPPANNPLSNRYRQLLRDTDDVSEEGASEGLPRRVGSPIGSLQSVPDDSPSVQGSVLSSPGSSLLPSLASRPGLGSPTPSFRPFDQRFQSRISSPSSLSPRPSSPAFLTGHSRNLSLSSHLLSDSGEAETVSPPWEVVRWTKLNKLNGQAFSEAGKRNFGSPTCVAVTTSIVLGTSKGIILVFDYNQNLKLIIGPGTRAVECGAITAIAISADHTTIAGGHENGRNVERATDTMGLTAMLTPYLLVIVSTTPVAQTQHKSARPKDVAPHSAMSGCLAWFPAVKLKVPDPATGGVTSRAKLVYCWSNVLTVLDVEEIPSGDKDKPPTLRFKARSRWKCEEAIVAVQWLSRSVLTVLTITQRLIVLEDRSMRMTEAFDLIHKHIYHVDLFSNQLHALVEQLDEEDSSMHGVVADAFYMSFKAYKGRIFLLGFNDVSIGTLSNWADRLIALMEDGDYVGAIQLATSYYTGDADKLTVGLPEDAELRHQMVHDKLMEIMSASLKYAFSQRQKDSTAVDDQHLRELTETCFVACQSVGNTDFLFDEMYEWFEESAVEGIFLETLEPYILAKTISSVPPTAVKAMVTHYVAKGWESRLEEMVCHMDTATLDLDQVTLLCKQHGLYDALIYVWNQAIHDYITPLIDLLTLLIPLTQGGDFASSESLMNENMLGVNALKMFPYLSYTLTGRIYPTGAHMDDTLASQAKAEIYWFLFSGQSVTWPKGSGKTFLTRPGETHEPSFPYLRMILKFDAPSFLSALNEAFEDSFLNEAQEKHLNGGTGRDLPEEQTFGLTVDRQYVVSILLEIMNPSDFVPEDTIYLDMFIARNLPKFPQYLLIPGSTLNKVITGLCNYPGADLAEDAQLSAEYLLSVYHPPDLSPMIPLFKQAGFYRILKRIYRNEKQYGKLIQIYFEDPEDQEEIFDCIADCLRTQAGPTKRQIQDVHDVLKQHPNALVELDPVRAAQTLGRHAPELHRFVLDSLDGQSELQYLYLKTLLEPEPETSDIQSSRLDRDFVEQYLQLMCRHNPSHVSDYVGIVQATNLRLDKLLPTMEDTGVIDAAVILMAREGQVQDAMQRLTRHMDTLESALQGLVSGTGEGNHELDVEEAAEDLLKGLQKYTHVGIWLCQGQMKTAKKANSVQQRQKPPAPTELTPEENLWLDLIDTTVQITRRLSSVVASTSSDELPENKPSLAKVLDSEKLVGLLRSLVQHTFTALLTTTSTSTQGIDQSSNHLIASSDGSATFLRILRAFLARAATTSPSLADLRAVLTSIFAAYAYEESILNLSNRLLEQQLFADVRQAYELRQRGWRPRGSTCEACGRRVWGPGVAGNVFEAWEERQADEARRRRERKAALTAAATTRGKRGRDETEYPGGGTGKGKGKDTAADIGGVVSEAATRPADDAAQAPANGDSLTRGKDSRQQPPLGPLVVFACRHIYHKSCLDTLQEAGGAESRVTHRRVDEYGRETGVAYRCPIDG